MIFGPTIVGIHVRKAPDGYGAILGTPVSHG